MSNFKKSFSFRSGVQVDDDNFIVTTNGTVGIGTTIPTQFLDVRGNASVSGFITASSVFSSGVSTFTRIRSGNGIIIDGSTGIITATSFYGDGATLSNLPTSQWVDVNQPGLGFTSIYAQGNVGIATTNPNSVFALQVGLNPLTSDGVGINSRGSIYASGIITASSFVGSGAGVTSINADNISSGTLSNDRLPLINNSKLPNIQVGIITATTQFFGNLTGIATVARSLTGTPNIEVGVSTMSRIAAGLGTIGIATITNALYVTNSLSALNNGYVGVGTLIPSTDFQVRKSASTRLEVISDTASSTISIGNSVGLGNSSVAFTFEGKTLKINNYDTGGVSVNLHEGTGTGTTEGFKVRYDNSNILNATFDGKVSINKETPEYNLDVNGDVYISDDTRIVGVLTVGTGSNLITLGDGSPLPMTEEQNFNTLSGVSTFNDFVIRDELSVGSTATFSGIGSFFLGVGIGTTLSSGYKLHNFGKSLLIDDVIAGKNLILALNPEIGVLSDPRTIPPDRINDVPFLDYGRLQVQNVSSSFISQQVLFVPYVGVATVGFGSTNLGIKPGGTYDSDKYIAKIGINTYFARCVLDVGTGSTSTNTYFIPPSLPQSDIDIMANLWDPSTSSALTGHAQAYKTTPNGIVPGAILHNQTTDRIQVGYGTNSFRNLSPVVAFATVDSGSLVSTDGYNLSLTNNLANAIFSFGSALPNANYTVMVSFGSTTESYTVPEAQKLTTGFRITFSPSNANTQSYSVMILQI